jgi:lipopolysaccharide heptosyltransferase II
MQQPQHILIRLPNWLGDMVMSTALVKAVAAQYPAARIDLIAKKGIDFLLDYFPLHGERYIFSKETSKGLTGTWRFGKAIRAQQQYDLFICLPDSFSSAVMGKAIGATTSIGYKKELRSLLFTHTYHKKKQLHRVEQYVDLLQQYTGNDAGLPVVELHAGDLPKQQQLIININSEAESRRLPLTKAVSIINTIRRQIREEIILVGSPKEKPFVDDVFSQLSDTTGIRNVSGHTSLPELVRLFGSVSTVLTTDSGPAHVANALGAHTIVLFGAGNEKNTAPYNDGNRQIIRLGQLPCEPCVSNTCKIYGTPECLLRLDEQYIAGFVKQALQRS